MYIYIAIHYIGTAAHAFMPVCIICRHIGLITVEAGSIVMHNQHVDVKLHQHFLCIESDVAVCTQPVSARTMSVSADVSGNTFYRFDDSIRESIS